MTKNKDAGNRIRTCESTKLSGPKPDPFDHSGIPACGDKLIMIFKAILDYFIIF